jgi:superfamily II DNA or RNA helicase
MSYFSSCADEVSFMVKKAEGEPGLRECQAGACWAVKAHFTSSDEPALVVLPTGAGKTALMMLLAFELGASRVLIVTPTKVLRDQTRQKFADLAGLRRAGVIKPDLPGPNVTEQVSRITDLSGWHNLEAFDVVVAVPHPISPVHHPDIVDPPVDLFDLVFFDEAHHLRAPSWDRLMHGFRGARQVLLTATPFRRDRRRLPGRLAYYYPLSKAMEAGIYQRVDFAPVNPLSPTTRDDQLASRAAELLEKVRGTAPEARLLARTDSIEGSGQLVELYNTRGIIVEAVHSGRTERQNSNALARVHKGELDGIVGVGMLGEGLDIPDLKVAVFHVPPKSFPFTIQLIGRVTRPIGGGGVSAYIVADPEQLREEGVEREVRRLYSEDYDGWHGLIPELVRQVSGTVLRDRTHRASALVIGAYLDDLRPFLSTRLYRVSPDNIDLGADVKLNDEYRVFPLPTPIDQPLLGLITDVLQPPPWATRTAIETAVFDLHLYYYHEPSHILFEATTSETIAAEIRDSILGDDNLRLGGDELIGAMQCSNGIDYIVAGLASTMGSSRAIPSYKMYMGDAVQGAVTPSDQRAFVRGHLFGRLRDTKRGEIRGISDKQGRIWSSRRVSISEFMKWCSSIGRELLANQGAKAPTDFAFFKETKRLYSFPDEPILAMMDPHCAAYLLELYAEDLPGPAIDFERATLEIEGFDGPKKERISIVMRPQPLSDLIQLEAEPINLVYSIPDDSWNVIVDPGYRIDVDDGFTRRVYPLSGFLREFPPRFYLPDGGFIMGGTLYQAAFDYAPLPDECIVADIDWSDCEITVEYGLPPEAPRKDVHKWLTDCLKRQSRSSAIIFNDHGSREVADLIVLDSERRIAKFYHCKSASKVKKGPRRGEPDIGATIVHLKEVIEQVLRSTRWIGDSRLLDRIADRNARDIAAHFVQGESLFDSLRDEFRPIDWDYEVFIVQPGLDAFEARRRENTNMLLLNCHEWLSAANASLRIMGAN